MTNQDLINKLNQYPKDKQIVFFCNQDVFLGQEFVWNECFIDSIKECLYIEYDDKIFSSLEELEEHLIYYGCIQNIDDVNEIIINLPKKEVIRIELNIT
jgi:hypothetical protein